MARINILDDIITFLGMPSGGSWETTLPLANLLDQEPKRVARSTDATEASTLFVIDLGHLSPCSLFALVNHNLSSSAGIRFRLSSASNLSDPTIDVTVMANAANIIFGSQPWGAFPWNGFLEDEQPGGPSTFYKHPSTEFGRYIGVDISDTANENSYVDIGVFAAGEPFVPAINFAIGAGLGIIDPSTQTRAQGGPLYTDQLPKRRTLSASFDFLTEAEAIGAVYRRRRRLGISGALLVTVDPDATDGVLAAQTIYARLTRVDDPIRYARNANEFAFSANFEVEELI